MKKNIIVVAVLVLVGFAIGSWYFLRNPSQSSSELYQGQLTIGMETWPGYFPLLVARDKGYFREAGLDVDIKRYAALGELSKDYVAGKMQGRANLTLDAVKEHLDGLDHKVVLAIDYSNGSDAIVAQTGINTVKDFRGKQIGYEPGTLEEFFLSWAFLENEMSLSDITPIHANPEETAKKLASAEIAAGVTHEPFLSRFLKEGNLHVVYSSADAPGLITDVLTFRTDFIEQYPETVQAIIQVYFKALHLLESQPDEVYAIIAKEYEDTPESIAKQFQGITMLNERDNQTAFTFAAGLKSLYGNMRQIGEFVQKHQANKSSQLDTDKLIERKFIKDVHFPL